MRPAELLIAAGGLLAIAVAAGCGGGRSAGSSSEALSAGTGQSVVSSARPWANRPVRLYGFASGAGQKTARPADPRGSQVLVVAAVAGGRDASFRRLAPSARAASPLTTVKLQELATAANLSRVLPLPSASLADRSLDQLSPEVAPFVLSRTGRVAVTAILPSRSIVYKLNGEARFQMASTAKVAILATVMDRAMREVRELAEDETTLLDAMIRVSDNDAASELWSRIGGGEQVEAYLQSIGLGNVEMDRGTNWGSGVSSVDDLAMLFMKLGDGEILSQPLQSQALELLSHVVPEQRWGITAGISGDDLQEGLICLKNGWYPDTDGWRVHSAGMVIPIDGRRGYVMVIMTEAQPSLEYGIETIDQIARLLNLGLRDAGEFSSNRSSRSGTLSPVHLQEDS